MPFDGSQTIKVKPGARVKVELVRLRPKFLRPLQDKYLHGRPGPEKWRQPARFAFYDLGTFYTVNTDNSSGYRETGTEIASAWTARDAASVRNELTSNLYRTNVGGSGREIENCCRLQSGSTETDGLITALVLKNGGASQRYDLISASPTWSEQVPAATRLAAIDSLPTGPATQGIAAARNAVVAESLESWEPYSANRTGRDGTMVCRNLDGRYTVAVESARSFYSFDTADLVNFKITDEPAYERPEAPTVAVEFGDMQSTSVDVWLVPQMVQTTIQWITRYLFISLFDFGYFTWANTGAYLSRLPFYPLAYNLNFAGTATQSVTMSARIRRTNTYAQMIASDLARQAFTPWYLIILESRYDGRWTIYQREIPEGQLVGVLRMRYQNGPPIVRYIWRRTRLDRPFVALDAGRLDVPGEVTGALTL